MEGTRLMVGNYKAAILALTDAFIDEELTTGDPAERDCMDWE